MLLQHSGGFPLGYIREGLYQLVIRLIVLPVGYKVLGLVLGEVFWCSCFLVSFEVCGVCGVCGEFL